MAEYTLTVLIDETHVHRFNTQGYKLCFAAGVAPSATGSPQYTVIATASTVAPKVDIKWTEQYGIAASKNPFMDSVRITTSTGVTPIKFGQRYTQPSDFTNGSLDTSTTYPQTGFIFLNQADRAAAVVYKKIRKPGSNTFDWAPIYLSKGAPLDPGSETLIPKVTVTVWFSLSGGDGTMISDFEPTTQEIDYTHNKEHKVTVSYDGTWALK